LIGLARPGFFDEREPKLARRLALAPLVPLACAYGAGAWLARRAHGRLLPAPARLSARVVSVGGLTVGGSGKTPTAAWIAARLRERGHRVALASRGYGRAGRARTLVVSDGVFVYAGAAEAGDEPLLLAALAPGVPVLVGRDRAAVGQRAIALFGIDVLVLDDGFQHHRVSRDVEIVTFDGSGLGNGALLPRGPLREGLSELARADAIWVVDGPLPASDAERIERHAPAARWCHARRRPTDVRPLRGGAAQPAASLAGCEVGLLSGIAQPGSLRRTASNLGARVVAERRFPDHHRYRERDLRGLAGRAPVWITTQKDALKILPSWAEALDLRVLGVELEVDGGEEFVDWLDRALRAQRRFQKPSSFYPVIQRAGRQ
jgi:tetraacyldisaccharide 4'-kinase